MSQTSASSSHKNKRPLGAPSPGFFPYALYVAIVEKTIAPADSRDQSPPTTQESLELFYLDRVTSAPLGSSRDTEPGMDVRYWSLFPSKQPKNDSMCVRNALCNMDVLGYLRVADLGSVDPRLIPAVIQADDRKVPRMEYISSEIYVFNALDRLRKQGVLEAHMGKWDLEGFLTEIKHWRNEWKKQGAQREWDLPRPFMDCRLILFNEQVHY